MAKRRNRSIVSRVYYKIESFDFTSGGANVPVGGILLYVKMENDDAPTSSFYVDRTIYVARTMSNVTTRLEFTGVRNGSRIRIPSLLTKFPVTYAAVPSANGDQAILVVARSASMRGKAYYLATQ